MSEQNPIEEILQYHALVRLETPVCGYWNGGAKSRFKFTPSIERTPGKPAIRWGSWEANLWFVINIGASPARHFASLRRKLLRGDPPRTITIEKAQ